MKPFYRRTFAVPKIAYRRPLLDYSKLEPRQLLAAIPFINEFQASNNQTLLDGNGNSSDWIEIYNAGDAAVDLAGWALTDDAAELSQWVFPNSPSSQLGPGEFLLVFASGDNTPDLAGLFHTNFKLSAAGEYLAGRFDRFSSGCGSKNCGRCQSDAEQLPQTLVQPSFSCRVWGLQIKLPTI